MEENCSEDTILGRLAKERDKNSRPEDYIALEDVIKISKSKKE